MRTLNMVILLLLLFALYALTMTSDFNDEVKYQEFACEMVKRGVWTADFCK